MISQQTAEQGSSEQAKEGVGQRSVGPPAPSVCSNTSLESIGQAMARQTYAGCMKFASCRQPGKGNRSLC